jgi:acetyl-CoA C-acetyltransferase
MVDVLRGRSERGLVYANGGFATDNHAILLSGAPLPFQPHDWNVQAQADARRGAVPQTDEDYTGPATLETYTVFYDRSGAASGGVVVARTAAGSRTLAAIDVRDPALLSILTNGAVEPVGQSGHINMAADHRRVWSFA